MAITPVTSKNATAPADPITMPKLGPLLAWLPGSLTVTVNMLVVPAISSITNVVVVSRLG